MADEEAVEQIPPIGKFAGERNELLERHGKGSNLFPNGDTFEGTYSKGKRNGQGKYIWKATGARYNGEYSSGTRNGSGELIYPDGSRYNGEFKDGKKHGLGKYVYANGDVYEGEFQGDVKHGQGSYAFANIGVTKSGNWVNGQLQGQGQVEFPSILLKGTFVNNDSMEPLASVEFERVGNFKQHVPDTSAFGLKPLQAQ